MPISKPKLWHLIIPVIYLTFFWNAYAADNVTTWGYTQPQTYQERVGCTLDPPILVASMMPHLPIFAVGVFLTFIACFVRSYYLDVVIKHVRILSWASLLIVVMFVALGIPDPTIALLL